MSDAPSTIAFVACDETLKAAIGEQYDEASERHVRLADDCSFVAMEGDRVVGFVSVYARPLPPPLSEFVEGYINVIAVCESRRRRGIARRLLDLCIERGRSLGFCQLRGWSSDDKLEAIPMWRALGFGISPVTDREVNGVFSVLAL